jgi:hypothetical protein
MIAVQFASVGSYFTTVAAQLCRRCALPSISTVVAHITPGIASIMTQINFVGVDFFIIRSNLAPV